MSKYFFAVIFLLIGNGLVDSENTYYIGALYIIVGVSFAIDSYLNLENKIKDRFKLLINSKIIDNFCYIAIVLSLLSAIFVDSFSNIGELIFILIILLLTYC